MQSDYVTLNCNLIMSSLHEMRLKEKHQKEVLYERRCDIHSERDDSV